MLHIVVIDDSKLARKRVIETIKKFDIEHTIVGEASDGLEGLKIIQENCIDLVITDLEMPNMDGLQLIQEIRTFNDNLNILVVSSIASQQMKQTLKSDRYIDYIKKPLNIKIFEMLLLRIEHKLIKGTNE